jgi:glucans biosynthesis protein C
MRKENIPLRNLRGVVIILILAFHCFSAYIVNQPAHPFTFNQAPYHWLAFPIIDSRRWLGFDLFCASQFLYLMQLMFFLSGLFVWSSLQRKGWTRFFAQRLLRLGVPFVLGVYALMPLAFYAVYRVSAVDPGWPAFWQQWSALPFTPTGPMWFLWYLIALNALAAVLFRLAEHIRGFLPGWLVKIVFQPGRLFIMLVCVTAAAYLPLSMIYPPWKWIGVGPFEIQAAFAPQYALYFLLGFAVGIYGHDRGLLDANGMFVRRWWLWSLGSIGFFALWLIPAALTEGQPGAPLGIRIAGDLALVTFAASTCFAMTAALVRFARARWPIVDTISENAYGIYFFHYPIVLWLQFALLGAAVPAIVKGTGVFIATVMVSLAASALTNRVLAASEPLRARLGLLVVSPTRAENFSNTQVPPQGLR